jgi:hypothetical protein
MPLIYSPRRWAAFCAFVGDSLFVAGGNGLVSRRTVFLSESLVMYNCTCGQYKWKRLPRMPEAMYNGIEFALGSDLFVVAAWVVA